MKPLTLLLAILLTGCANQTPYFSVGAGYKFDESPIKICKIDKSRTLSDGSHFTQCWYNNDKTSARFELGVDGGNYKIGISHDSQWFSGWPFNERGEYGKNEVFAEYVFKFGE